MPVVSSCPWAQRASAGDRTDLTLVQVSWPCGGRWNEIFLSSSLNTGKNQWALYSIRTVESILSPKKSCPVPSVSILQLSQTSQPPLCGHSWTRITQSMCPALDNTQSKPPVWWPCPLFSHFIPVDLLNWTRLLYSYWYSSRCCWWGRTSGTVTFRVWQQLVHRKWHFGN